ncbi:MAG: response regulator, partial [bacterium]
QALGKLLAAEATGEPFHLLITDLMMPELDGMTLARIVKAEVSLTGTAMILLSSNGAPADRYGMRDAGFSACLSKPIKPSYLFNSIVTALGGVASRVKTVTSSSKTITSHLPAELKQRIRILVAEDNHVNQKLVVQLLAKFGLKADTVGNGQEVIHALEMIDYDLVLMDVNMPEMDGLEATMIIRDPASAVLNHAVPIVALTAHAMAGDREGFLAAGMDRYVAKPVRPDELLAAIERCLLSGVVA